MTWQLVKPGISGFAEPGNGDLDSLEFAEYDSLIAGARQRGNVSCVKSETPTQIG